MRIPLKKSERKAMRLDSVGGGAQSARERTESCPRNRATASATASSSAHARSRACNH
jgi:hypothetical protein